MKEYKAELIFKTPSTDNYFFGYYDKLQLNKSNNKFLALKINFIDHVPNLKDEALIGYFDLVNQDKFIEIAKTSAFNLQQGCMLQWLGPDYNTKVVYNDMIDNNLVSIIIDIKSGEKKVCDYAIYSMHPNGIHAVTIDFERHHWCRRGYSYDGNFSDRKNKSIVENDAIWLVDLNNNSRKEVIKLKDMMQNQPLSNMSGATHYLEHLMFNSSGDRFCFLHRWKIADGGIYARLYTANIDGSDLFLLNDSGRMSHYSWQDNKHLLAYGGLKTKVNKLRRYKSVLKYFIKPLLPMYHSLVNDNSKLSKMLTGDSYILFEDKTNNVNRVAKVISNEDGHPSFSKNGDNNIFVTDNYPDPDEGSVADLILFDLKSNQEYFIDTLNSISEYDNSPVRCDLHPRWSFDGNFVSIDTMNDGIRSCYLYRITYE